MPRPFTRNQTLENRAFLAALRRSGNIRLAAREIGVAYGTIQHRRRTHPGFAQGCAAALAFAQARFHEQGGTRAPRATDAGRAGGAASNRSGGSPPGTARPSAHRTSGGEPVVVRNRDGTLQMRRAQPGKLTRQCEQAFLAALSATANVRLAAAAAGASVAAFYRRRRKNPGFAREMRLALAQGYAVIELALLESMDPRAYADDDWRHNDPPAMPPMTADQALQLLQLHQKEVRLGGTPDALRRRPGEPREAMRMRLVLMSEERDRRAREDYAVAEAARRARGEPSPFEVEVVLPDLAQVTGWSRAEAAEKEAGKTALGRHATDFARAPHEEAEQARARTGFERERKSS